MSDQVYYQAKRFKRLFQFARVVREPDQCTGRQDVRKNSVDSINELIDQVNRATPKVIVKELIDMYMYIYILIVNYLNLNNSSN